MFELLKNLDLRVRIFPTPFFYDKRWGLEWSRKTYTHCPFGRFEKDRWFKIGFRLYYGSRKHHIAVSWGKAFDWCPIKKGACDK